MKKLKQSAKYRFLSFHLNDDLLIRLKSIVEYLEYHRPVDDEYNWSIARAIRAALRFWLEQQETLRDQEYANSLKEDK